MNTSRTPQVISSLTILRGACTCLPLLFTHGLFAQAYSEADRGEPGDAMIQQYLRQAAEQIESNFLGSIRSAEDWAQSRPRFRQEYFQMLGLSPLPEKSPLHATVSGTLDRGDYVVDMLHYQSRPGLYVTGNLYR